MNEKGFYITVFNPARIQCDNICGSHCAESYKQSKHNNTTGFYCESWHISFNGS